MFCSINVSFFRNDLQQWERSSTPLHTFQRFTVGGVEEVIESMRYGIEVRRETMGVACCLS